MNTVNLCRDFWNGPFKILPENLARRLLMGSAGLVHLAEMTEDILLLVSKKGKRELLPLGAQMLLAAYESDPFNASLASQVDGLEKLHPFVPVQLKPILKWLGESYREPIDQRYLMRLVEQRDTPKVLNYLAGELAKEPGNPFWLHHSVSFGIMENQLGWLLEQLDRFQGLPAPLADYIKGAAAFAGKDWELAADFFTNAARAIPLHTWQEQAAQALYNLGEHGDAADMLRRVLTAQPWRANTLLRLHDMKTGLAGQICPPEGSGAILFYTWNKDGLLDDALRAVCENERYGAKIHVIDNGSTDNTPAVLAAWKERLGDDFKIITLPVNVGAPAARNWLAALPEARQADWLAYMDDDAVVPPAWLGRFGAAMQAYPKAGIYGCKIVDMHTNMTIQSADFHLLPGEGKMDEGGAIDRKFRVSALQLQCFNYGQFDYARPCASVTGCCHLFRRKLFDRVGGFDLRYSPSQYDDLEHDLRAAVQGELPIYQGHLTVSHAKRTGKDAQTNPSQMSNALGNLMKLQMRYSEEEFEQIRRHDAAAALTDILSKAETLGL